MKGITTTTILVIFGLVMLLVVIGIFAVVWEQAWPLIRHGPCWGKIKGGINVISDKIDSEKNTIEQKIVFEGCAGFLGFANYNEIANIEKIADEKFDEDIGCKSGESYQGYIVGMPFFPDTDSRWWNPLSWAEDIGENGIQYVIGKKLAGIVPVCERVKLGFSGNYEKRIIEGPCVEKGKDCWEGEKKIYCITLAKNGDVYDLGFEEAREDGKCDWEVEPQR